MMMIIISNKFFHLALYLLLSLSITQQFTWKYHDPHFTCDKTEAQRDFEEPDPNHTAGKEESQVKTQVFWLKAESSFHSVLFM